MRTRILGIVLAVVLAIGGAVALTAYVSGADARALAGTRTVHVYVVKTEVPAATPAADLQPYIQVKDVPAVAAVGGRVVSLASIEGLTTNSPIEPGEQLLNARFSKPAQKAVDPSSLPAGMQAMTLRLPLQQAVGGDLHAGDHVSVAITGNQKAQQKLHRVQVLAVQLGDTSAPKGTTSNPAPVSVVLVTLALRSSDVTAVVWGQQFGAVWLSKEAGAPASTSSSTVTGVVCDSTCTGSLQ